VFCTAWGEPVHPDTVSSLMSTLIKAHNEAHLNEAYRTRGCMTCGTCTRQLCCWPAFRSMSSPLASATPTL
jgi:heterodisulfide reductase subunit C